VAPAEHEGKEPELRVVFYRSETGNQPVRDWLLGLSRVDRKIVGRDTKTAQYGWPLGMPLIRKLEPGLWEVRSRVSEGIARVVFTVEGDEMVLLHGFIKKSTKMRVADRKTARLRLARLRGA